MKTEEKKCLVIARKILNNIFQNIQSTQTIRFWLGCLFCKNCDDTKRLPVPRCCISFTSASKVKEEAAEFIFK